MKCKTPNCKNDEAPAWKRGLCTICHPKANRLINAGTTTWDELVALGLATKIEDADPFTQEFVKRKREADAQGS